MARVIFLGTSEFAVPILEALARSHQVAAVYTQPDRPAGRGLAPAASPVKETALRLSLPVLQPARLREPGVAEAMTALQPEALVLAAYGQFLPQAVLGIPPKGCLNVHPSLLPRHRGPTPIQGAILAGDQETGVTVMLMDAGMDSGPLLAQRHYPIGPEATASSLTQALAQRGAGLLLEILPLWLEGGVTSRPQDEAQVTFTRILTKADGALNWHLSALELARRIRAFTQWPGSYTWWQGKRLAIHEARPLLEAGGGVPGRVVSLRGRYDQEVGVETGHGLLGLVRVQLEGKRPLPAGDFLRGQHDFLGSVLPSPTLPRL